MSTSLKQFILRAAAVCGLMLSTGLTAHAQATRVPGRIVAASVQGAVTALDQKSKTSVVLKKGDEIKQDYVITTSTGASVVLVFSNGATVDLGADTTLSIDEFLQEPFSGENVIASAKSEPSTSTTKLRLIRGELSGSVKKLNRDKGSSYAVNTAVGAAGVRGTVFRVVVRADENGRLTFSLATSEGEVLLSGIDGSSVSVEAGREVSLDFEGSVDPDTGEITVTGTPTIPPSEDMSDDTRTALQAIVDQIATALEGQTLTLPPDNDANNNTGNGNNNNNNNSGTDVEERPNSPLK